MQDTSSTPAPGSTPAPSSTPAPRKRRRTRLTPAKPVLPVRAVADAGGRGRFADDGPALRAVAGDALHPSPANPRKHFGAAEIAELAASMKQDGVLQPLLVRPLSPAMAALHEGDGERGGPLSSVEKCKHTVDALVVVGLRRGTRIRICPRRSRCTTHWKEHVEHLKRKREQAALRKHLLSGTWDADAMIRVVLDALRSDDGRKPPPAGLDPLHEAAYLAVTGGSWDREGVVARARVLGVQLDRRGRLVEPKRGDHGPIPPGVQPSARAAAACDGPSAADGSGGGI